MVDTRQGKIFVTRDEGDSFTGRQLEFTPNNIRFQGLTVPKSSEGTLPEHMMGYEAATQSVCPYPSFLAHCTLSVLQSPWHVSVYIAVHVYKYIWTNSPVQGLSRRIVALGKQPCWREEVVKKDCCSGVECDPVV